MSLQIPPGADLTKLPSGIPPEGTMPLAPNPPSLQPLQLGLVTTLMVIGTVFALISWIEHTGKRGLSDWLSLGAVICSIGYTALTFDYTPNVHSWDQPLSQNFDPSYIKKQFAQTTLFGPTMFLAKAAILALYLRIFRVNAYLRIAVYCALAVDTVAYIPQLITGPVLCAPRAGHPWDISVSMHCGKSLIWGITAGSLGVALDLFLFVIPIPAVAALNMSLKRKWAVIAVFSTAFLGIVASIASLACRILLHQDMNDTAWWASALEIAL